MHATHADDTTFETQQLKLPPDLLAEMSRRTPRKTDFRVDGWKPSLLERLTKLFGLG